MTYTYTFVSDLPVPHLPIKASDLSCFELTKCLLLILMGRAYSSVLLLLLDEGGAYAYLFDLDRGAIPIANDFSYIY